MSHGVVKITRVEYALVRQLTKQSNSVEFFGPNMPKHCLKRGLYSRLSLLDLTLASRDIASKCLTTVSDALVNSDHYTVFTNINQKIENVHTKPRSCSLS